MTKVQAEKRASTLNRMAIHPAISYLAMINGTRDDQWVVGQFYNDDVVGIAAY